MTPPTMAGWNLALRFGLELGALAGLGLAAWRLGDGPSRWVLAAAIPLGAAIVWGTFNVVGDPSRSGAAPVEVDGWIRLGVELAVLGAGAAGLWFAGQHPLAIAFAALVAVQYATSMDRVGWLLAR